MGDPGYDFFATGGASTATPVAPATVDGETLPAETLAYGASVNRFGSPVALDNQTLKRPDFETTTLHSAVLLEGFITSW